MCHFSDWLQMPNNENRIPAHARCSKSYAFFLGVNQTNGLQRSPHVAAKERKAFHKEYSPADKGENTPVTSRHIEILPFLSKRQEFCVGLVPQQQCVLTALLIAHTVPSHMMTYSPARSAAREISSPSLLHSHPHQDFSI